jgi:hypothetical protein
LTGRNLGYNVLKPDEIESPVGSVAMKVRTFGRALTAAAITLGCFAFQASASTIVFFGPPDFVWFHQGTNATPNHIWLAGDYWAQDFTIAGLSEVDQLTVDLAYNDDTLTGPSLDLNAMLDGTVVGSFAVPPGVHGLRSYTFYFSPIAGPNYDIELIATNSIPLGEGSVSIADNNRTSAAVFTGVPEPGTIGLLGLGTAVLLLLRRRRAA